MKMYTVMLYKNEGGNVTVTSPWKVAVSTVNRYDMEFIHRPTIDATNMIIFQSRSVTGVVKRALAAVEAYEVAMIEGGRHRRWAFDSPDGSYDSEWEMSIIDALLERMLEEMREAFAEKGAKARDEEWYALG